MPLVRCALEGPSCGAGGCWQWDRSRAATLGLLVAHWPLPAKRMVGEGGSEGCGPQLMGEDLHC